MTGFESVPKVAEEAHPGFSFDRIFSRNRDGSSRGRRFLCPRRRSSGLRCALARFDWKTICHGDRV